MSERYASAIRDTLARATPEDWQSGADWYPRARAEARKLAKVSGLTLRQSAGIIAALSPRVHWSVCLSAAANCAVGRRIPGIYGANWRKAEAIRDGARPLDVLGGPKTRAFYANITGDDSAVTVDVWAMRAAGWTRPSVSPKQYDVLADAYREVAAGFGVSAPTLQATAWIVARGRAW